MRLTVSAVVVALTAWLALAVPAVAVPSCTYDAATLTAAVTADAGDSPTIGRTGDAITLDGTACGAATVSTTDTVTVTTLGVPASITLDLGGGGFVPGSTVETDGDSEIEFTVNVSSGSPILRVAGTTGGDNVVLGTDGLNLNAAEASGDVDVAIVGSPAMVLEGGDGADVLSVGGGAGTGAPGRVGTLLGQAGDDLLLGGVGGSMVDGGDGLDEVDYAGAVQLVLADLGADSVEHQGGTDDTLIDIENLTGSPGDDRIVGDGGDNALDGADGTDVLDFSGSSSGVVVDLRAGLATGVGNDTVIGLEVVIGSPQNDVVVGDNGPNVLEGGAGDDSVDGAGGNDTLLGGPDDDTVSFASSSQGVTVDLRKGTADGDGADTLAGFENAHGSRKGDEIRGDEGKNRLDGLGGADELFGGKDADVLLGGTGNELLFGQKGNDLVLGGPGKDQLNGGQGEDRCKGGPDPDSYVFCENFPT